MGEFVYYDPTAETDTSGIPYYDWNGLRSGESDLVDYARSKSYSTNFSESSDAFFSDLSDSQYPVTSDMYIRGLQILYKLGLYDIVEPFWSYTKAVEEFILDPIDNSKSFQTLKDQASRFIPYVKLCESIISNSVIDNSIIEVVKLETRDLGDLAQAVRGCLYYYIILGSLRTLGGFST